MGRTSQGRQHDKVCHGFLTKKEKEKEKEKEK
jgi:hypothetical protein